MRTVLKSGPLRILIALAGVFALARLLPAQQTGISNTIYNFPFDNVKPQMYFLPTLGQASDEVDFENSSGAIVCQVLPTGQLGPGCALGPGSLLLGQKTITSAGYTVLTGDQNYLLSLNTAAANTILMPLVPPPSTSAGDWFIFIQNIGNGGWTLSGNGNNIDGIGATIPIPANTGLMILSNGTGYYTERGLGSTAGGTVIAVTATAPITSSGGASPNIAATYQGTPGKVFAARTFSGAVGDTVCEDATGAATDVGCNGGSATVCAVTAAGGDWGTQTNACITALGAPGGVVAVGAGAYTQTVGVTMPAAGNVFIRGDGSQAVQVACTLAMGDCVFWPPTTKTANPSGGTNPAPNGGITGVSIYASNSAVNVVHTQDQLGLYFDDDVFGGSACNDAMFNENITNPLGGAYASWSERLYFGHIWLTGCATQQELKNTPGTSASNSFAYSIWNGIDYTPITSGNIGLQVDANVDFYNEHVVAMSCNCGAGTNFWNVNGVVSGIDLTGVSMEGGGEALESSAGTGWWLEGGSFTTIGQLISSAHPPQHALVYGTNVGVPNELPNTNSPDIADCNISVNARTMIYGSDPVTVSTPTWAPPAAYDFECGSNSNGEHAFGVAYSAPGIPARVFNGVTDTTNITGTPTVAGWHGAFRGDGMEFAQANIVGAGADGVGIPALPGGVALGGIIMAVGAPISAPTNFPPCNGLTNGLIYTNHTDTSGNPTWTCTDTGGSYAWAQPAAPGSTLTIASGAQALGTGAISSGTCAGVITVSAPGVLSTDAIAVSFNADPTTITGYGVSATGAVLTVYNYPTADNVNFNVCNSSSGSITPSAATINWRVSR